MFDRILVPTDGSPVSEQAMELAFSLAEDYEATVHALYVIDISSPLGHYDPVVERWEREGERAVESVAEAGAARSIPVTKSFRSGEIHKGIVGYAEDHDLDLIVIGTHGKTGIRRVMRAGSTAERVARLTTIPVLIVGGARSLEGGSQT